MINEIQKDNDSGNHINVLQKKGYLGHLTEKYQQLESRISQHSAFFQENARPNIVVKSEVDKFRGFLHDVISFEPDFILAPAKPRLHYFDEEGKQLFIHELASQTTQSIPLRLAESLPHEFSSIQAQNKIFIVGGEKKEGDVRSIYSSDCYVVNEQTYEVTKKASMKRARAGHQLAHLHRKFEYQTTDFVYAIGSKHPDETSKKCEVYDVARNRWNDIGDLNQGRHYHSCCMIENRYLYVIGGRDSCTENPLDSFERLDGFLGLENQSWEQIQLVNKDGAWTPRDTLGSFNLSDSEIIVFGGDYGWISDCFSFQTKSNEIQKIECSLKKPEEFFKAHAVRYNDKIFVLGCLDKDVHVYSIKAKKWFLLDKWFIDW